MKKIKFLYNRDGIETKLVFVNEKQCYLESELPYYNIIKENDKILSIDPPGGPILSLGDNYIPNDKNIVIERIEHNENGFFITIK